MVECRGFSMNTIKYWYGASVILLLVMACYSLINIEKQFIDTLKKQGLCEIETVQQKLNPNLHEALMQVPGEKDLILQEVEKGYMLNGKVIRHSKVIVGSGEEILLT